MPKPVATTLINGLPISDTIRNERLAVQASQQTLANKAGVHRVYISRLENGDGNVTLSTLIKIFDALGYNLDIGLVGKDKVVKHDNQNQ